MSQTRATALALALSILACGRDARSRDPVGASTTPVSDTAAAPRDVPYDPTTRRSPRQSGSERNTSSAARAPAAPATPSATDSVGDPVTVVQSYYAAIRAHDFLRAYRMWEVTGQTGGRSFAQFEAGFDPTESVDATVGNAGRIEGAAGSRFVTVPIELRARLKNGTPQRFSGSYTLRRVVVPGASAAQRRWHLYAANIRQVP